MNSRGEIQKRAHGESLFLNPDHIAITDAMNIVIYGRGNHTVYLIMPDRYVIFAYKEIIGPMNCFIDRLG
jgi:hypothetical protein